MEDQELWLVVDKEGETTTQPPSPEAKPAEPAGPPEPILEPPPRPSRRRHRQQTRLSKFWKIIGPPRSIRARVRYILGILRLTYILWYFFNKQFDATYNSYIDIAIDSGTDYSINTYERVAAMFDPPPMPDVYSMPPDFECQVQDVAFVVRTSLERREEYRAWLKSWDKEEFGEAREHVLFVGDHDQGLDKSVAELDYKSGDVEARNPILGTKMMESVESGSTAVVKYHGLKTAYDRFRKEKKWYVMLDDSTYLHLPSLIALLQRISPEKEYYLTTPSEDGGMDGVSPSEAKSSTSILSLATMERIYEDSNHNIPSPPSTSKPKTLLGEALSMFPMLAPIPPPIVVSPILGKHITTTKPQWTRISATNHCNLLLGFSSLTPTELLTTNFNFAKNRHPLRIEDIWDILGGKPALGEDAPDAMDIGYNWDQIGPTSSTRIPLSNLTHPQMAYHDNGIDTWIEYLDGSVQIAASHGMDSTECFEALWHGPKGFLTMRAEPDRDPREDGEEPWGDKCMIAPWMCVGERDERYSISYVQMTNTWGMPWDEWQTCGSFEWVWCGRKEGRCWRFTVE